MPVFGIHGRGGCLHCQIVKNCPKTTLKAIVEGRVSLSTGVTPGGSSGQDGLVEAGVARHPRINEYRDRARAVLSETGRHVNGIERFCRCAKRPET